MTETRDYDEAGRLLLLKSTQSSAPVASFGYTYDANGNRATLVETRTEASPETTTYGYDDANRLVAVAYPEETVLYSLDAVGNRKGEKKALPSVVAALTVAAYAALSPANASAMTERSFNAVDWMVASHQLVPAGLAPLAIAYDANGNRVSQGPRTYAWDIRDTLTTVTEAGSPLGTYDYDAQLQRVKADTADGHVEYALDGQFVLRESGARNRRYHFGEGEGLGVSDAAGPRWLLDDAQGSVSVEVSLASGGGSTPAAIAATTHRKYDAWGNYRSGTAPAGAEARLGYTGHQYDVESGLTYARARYYDSVNGVFLSRDSVEGHLGDAPSLHRWAYAHTNPLRYTDPTGHCGIDRYGRFITCADQANAWEAHRAEYRKWLASEITSDISTAKAAALAIPTLAVELGAALVDLGRLGEGAAEGGVRGYVADASRAVGIATLAWGVAKVGFSSSRGPALTEPGVESEAPVAGTLPPPSEPGPPSPSRMVESNTTPVTKAVPATETTPKKVDAYGKRSPPASGGLEGMVDTVETPAGRVPVGSRGGVVTEAKPAPSMEAQSPPVPNGAPEPEVQSFIRQFEERYPGRKYQSGHNRKTSDGREIEIDFETDNSIIEFKAGRGKGLTRQIGDRMDPAVNPEGKVCIGVACDAKGISPHVRKGIDGAGGVGASGDQVGDVLDVIAP